MRFNIKKLEAKGFTVVVKDDHIDIMPKILSETAYLNIKAVVTLQAGITDPSLQEYAIGAFLIAMERAQILEAAE